MYAVGFRFYIFVPIVGCDDNINTLSPLFNIEAPFATLDFLNCLLLSLLPPAAIRIHTANILNPFMRILTIGLINASDANVFGHGNALLDEQF